MAFDDVVLQLAADVIPLAPDDPHGVTGADVLGFVRRWVDALPRDIGWGLRAFAGLVQWLPLLLIFAPARYTRLAAAARLEYLHRLERSRIYLFRSALKALRTFVLMGYYGQPRVSRALGFDAARTRERSRAGIFLPGLPPGVETSPRIPGL
jgi:hypothetical protein